MPRLTREQRIAKREAARTARRAGGPDNRGSKNRSVAQAETRDARVSERRRRRSAGPEQSNRVQNTQRSRLLSTGSDGFQAGGPGGRPVLRRRQVPAAAPALRRAPVGGGSAQPISSGVPGGSDILRAGVSPIRQAINDAALEAAPLGSGQIQRGASTAIGNGLSDEEAVLEKQAASLVAGEEPLRAGVDPVREAINAGIEDQRFFGPGGDAGAGLDLGAIRDSRGGLPSGPGGGVQGEFNPIGGFDQGGAGSNVRQSFSRQPGDGPGMGQRFRDFMRNRWLQSPAGRLVGMFQGGGRDQAGTQDF